MKQSSFSDTFHRITELINLIDKTSDVDPSLSGELREKFMQISFSIKYIDPRLCVKNLPYFLMKVDDIILRGDAEKYGACFFNIKGCNALNRKIGYDRGTFVLTRFFQGLQASLGSDEIVSAVGGDNGVVLFKTVHQDIVEDYLKETHVIYNDETGESIGVHAIAGINPNLIHCVDHTDVMNSISPAAAIAKKDKSTTFVYYDEKLKNQLAGRSKIESLFKEAVEKRELEIFYQPKVYLKNYYMYGAEALCRWKIDGKYISPQNFVAILEQSNYIFDLDFYILETVCRDLREWLDKGKRAVQVSINLSKLNLVNENLARDIVKRIDEYDIPHSLIQIELKETVNDAGNIILKKLVYDLRNEGISVALDDFGTSFSSLNLLRKLPWNVVKLDSALLKERELGASQTKKLLEMIISITKNIGIECIAEGVETVEDITMLKSVGCAMAQGYFFDFPMPKEDFENKL